jgi:DNA polymerase III delta prime subunit
MSGAGDAAAVDDRDIWIERYRPQRLAEVHGQEDIIDRLQSYVDRGELPHLLFAGPAGVGKCVTGETPVHTSEGMVPIAEIVGQTDGFAPAPAELRVRAVDATGRTCWRRPVAVYGAVAEAVLDIETEAGATLSATPEHPVRVAVDGRLRWVPAAALTTGMQLVRPVGGAHGDIGHPAVAMTDGGTAAGTAADTEFRRSRRLRRDPVAAVVRREGPVDVYDLTVPPEGAFIGGQTPMIIHNTTSATAIAREVFGDAWRGNFLELNASDERGIDVVRDRIKTFARSAFGGHRYRIIFLDEADSLTPDAQAALRRTMEQYADKTRFILSCNYSSKIIDPIQSRCAVFRFAPLDDAAIAAQLTEIATAEGLEITEEGMAALVTAAQGDMRRGINTLQAAATVGDRVDAEAVYEIAAAARPEAITAMVDAAIAGEFTSARRQLRALIVEEGVAGQDIINQLHRSVWEFDLGEEATIRLMEQIGEVDYRISVGADEQIQLEALLAGLAAGS